MDSEMGHLCNLRILMAAVKMKIFNGNILVFVSYFCSKIADCGHTLEQK